MKKLLFIDDYAVAPMVAALAILLGGCIQMVEAQLFPSGDGIDRSTATVCDVDITFIYDDNGTISYHNLDNARSALVKLTKLSEEGDITFDSACLEPDATEKHGVTLENEMWLMVEVWRGKECPNVLQPCSENGAVTSVKHVPKKNSSYNPLIVPQPYHPAIRRGFSFYPVTIILINKNKYVHHSRKRT